jgi:cargo-transport protein YPP1
MPAEPPESTFDSLPSSSSTALPNFPLSALRPSAELNAEEASAPSAIGGRKQDPTPAQLNRLAARDRAYMLLSTLTKLGSGWDNPEAWLLLARAYELKGQVSKAKQALWWVVELEDSRGLRGWNRAGCAYVL